jgi:RNA polymerase sigma factor (sigma-70 family)
MEKTGFRNPARLAGASLLRLQSDERLAELAAAGHDAAFDAIVHRYRPALLRYCGAIAGSSRAEDAVQQTLINAHAALGDADEVRHLRSWLYRIAHNVSLNVLRGVRDDVSLDAEGLRLPVVPASSESFERSEQFRATVAALQALPERQRAALVLRELEGRSHEEIADALGVSAGSARQHLMRARVAMRGAVTALTPWGLIVRLAELASSGGGAPGGLETAAGAGLGAGLVKLTAGVMATGALVGGAAVGTHEVIRHDTAAPARADAIHTKKPAVRRAAAPARAAVVVAPTARTTPVAAAPARRHAAEQEQEHHHRGRGGDDHAASGRHGGDGHRGRGRGKHDDHQHAATQPAVAAAPTADDHRGHGGGKGKGHDEATTEHRSDASGSTRGHGRQRGEDDAKSGSSGHGSGKSGKSGKDEKIAEPPALAVPSTTAASGSSGSGDSSGSGSDSGDSGGSGSGKSDDDGSSGSGRDH